MKTKTVLEAAQLLKELQFFKFIKKERCIYPDQQDKKITIRGNVLGTPSLTISEKSSDYICSLMIDRLEGKLERLGVVRDET